MPRDDSVLIEDVGFNAFLAAANDALRRLLGDAGLGDLEPLVDAQRDALELLWHAPTGQYCSRDAVTHAPRLEPTIATFLPMLVSDAHVDELLARLRDPSSYWPAVPVPSVPLDAVDYQEHRYWKGPTWVNTNWAVVEGLRRRGRDALADDLRARTVEMVARHGFAEYFSPVTGAPHGAPEFSWTAALTIDLVAELSGGDLAGA
jgi:hypothetical protein